MRGVLPLRCRSTNKSIIAYRCLELGLCYGSFTLTETDSGKQTRTRIPVLCRNREENVHIINFLSESDSVQCEHVLHISM